MNKKTTKLEITQKVQKIRFTCSDEETAAKIGMSRNTMYKRLKSHNWKITEITHIESIVL